MNEPTNRTGRIYRPKDGRIVVGVCPGLVAYVSIERNHGPPVGFALLTAYGGLGALLYLCVWTVIPDETDGVPIAESFAGKHRP